MKKSFELVNYSGVAILAVAGEAFDWGIDSVDLDNLRLTVKKDDGLKNSFVGDLKHHFITCLSDFLGRPITFKEINEALERGYIEI